MLLALFTAALSLAVQATVHSPNSSPAGRMRAIVHSEFGSPDVMRLEEVERPVPGADQVLVRIRAASVNPFDWHFLEGIPYIARPLAFGSLRPTETRVGVDYAGTIEAVGVDVKRFRPGDEVFGAADGALAEFIAVRAEGALVAKPANVTFEQAASLPVAAITALQALRDRAHVAPGKRVLINGASGGVGTFAVQIARSLGAEVTGVCSTRNLDLVRSLGASAVVDYTREDFTRGDRRYDVILDNVGNRSIFECLRVLEPGGSYILIGGGGVTESRWLGPLASVLRLMAVSHFVTQEIGMFMADMNSEDLEVLGELVSTGKVEPVIDRTYRLSEAAEAMRYLEQGHARGKVVVTLDESAKTSGAGAETAERSEPRTGVALVVLGLFGVPLAVAVGPIFLALYLDRRSRRRHPGRRGFRWGYYFSLMSIVCSLLLAIVFDTGIWGVIGCGLVYGSMAWAFSLRRRWAWIALTLLSFNPIAWILNLIYLRKRWSETAPSST